MVSLERPGSPPELPGPWAARLAGAAGSRYRILGEVARGGMGRVLRVLDRRLDRILAMKVVRLPPGEEGREVARRFLDEVRATSRVQHPGVVPVHDVGIGGGRALWFTMPLVRGRSLAEVLPLARRGAEGWSRERVLGVLVRVCETVAHAHERGVVHRDLKPSNVMVGRFGETYVLDWGLARVRSSRETGSPAAGTPAYMAPEQRRGEGADPRSDVHALGAILYEVLAGHIPYGDLARDADVARALEGPPTPIRSRARGAPRELVAICEKAMARDPRGRYASALELAEDLRSHLEVRVVTAFRSGRLERFRKWSARNPRVAGLLALLALVLAVAVVDRSARLADVASAHERTQRAGYLAGIAAAQAALRDGDPAEARRRLALCPEPLRGFEWSHLALRSDESALVLGSHTDDVAGAAILAGGAAVVSASHDGTVRVHDLGSGASTRVVAADAPLDCLAVSDDDARGAVGARDGTVLRFELPGGRPLPALAGHTAPVTALAFEPGGERLASASHDGTVRVRGGERELVLAGQPAAPLHAVAWGADGRLFAGAAGGHLHLFDVDSGALRASTVAGGGHVYAMAVAPAAGAVAVGSQDGWIRFFDATTLDPRGAVQSAHASPVSALAYDRSGDRLASGSHDRTLAVWDARGGTLLARLLGHAGEVKAVAFEHGGPRLATGGADGSVRLWNPGSAAVAILRGHDGWVEDADVSAAGVIASAGRDDRVVLWRAATGERLLSVPTPDLAQCASFAPDGERLAIGTGDGRVRVHDVASGAFLLELAGPGERVVGARWSPDGRRVLARTAEGAVLSLSPDDGTLHYAVRGTGGLLEGLAVSPDGERFALARPGGVVSIHTAESGALEVELPPLDGEISALAWSPRGRLVLAGSSTGEAALLDAREAVRVAVLRGHDGRVTAGAFAPDGSRVATAGRDRALRFFLPGIEEPLAVLRGHDEWITALAFSADGAHLVSASKDGTVRVWSAR